MSRIAARIRNVLGWSLLAAAPLAAQEEPKRPWTLQTDFALVNTAGNTSTTTLSAGEEASYHTGRWKLGQSFEAVYGKTDGQRSAENYKATVRGDYELTTRIGAYLMAGWDRNEFAGISRRFEEGVGLAFQVVAEERTTLAVETGVSLNQERTTVPDDANFAAGRGAIRFKQLLGEKAYFQQLAEILPNLKTTDDVRVNSESALVAPISSRIAFKAGYVVRWDNDPEPGFKKTDRYLTSGLQVVF